MWISMIEKILLQNWVRMQLFIGNVNLGFVFGRDLDWKNDCLNSKFLLKNFTSFLDSYWPNYKKTDVNEKKKAESIWQQSGKLHENRAGYFCPWLKIDGAFLWKRKKEKNVRRTGWVKAIDPNKTDGLTFFWA